MGAVMGLVCLCMYVYAYMSESVDVDVDDGGVRSSRVRG